MRIFPAKRIVKTLTGEPRRCTVKVTALLTKSEYMLVLFAQCLDLVLHHEIMCVLLKCVVEHGVVVP